MELGLSRLFLLGISGALQLALLPGLIGMKTIKFPKGSLIQNLIYCFSLSLLGNYVLVVILTVVRLYKPAVVYLIFALELVFLIRLYWTGLNKTIGEVISTWLLSTRTALQNFVDLPHRSSAEEEHHNVAVFFRLVAFILLSILSYDAFVWFGKLFWYNIGDVFRLWDAIVSWNQWAKVWSVGQIPSSQFYPQLIPVNWSLVYVILGNEPVQFFVSWMMPLFPIFTLLLFFLLGVRARSFGILGSLIICRYMIKKFLGEYITDGYVDLALMFMVFVAVYTLIRGAEMTERKEKLRSVFLGFLFASAAAVTKQSGLYLLLLYPALAYWIVLKDAARSPNTAWVEFKPLLIKWFALSILIVLPWYLYTWVMIRIGVNLSNLTELTLNLHADRNLLERLAFAINLTGRYYFLFFLSAVFLPLLSRTYRILTLTLVLPFFLLWGVFLSYDTRNLSFTFPLVCLVAGIGFERLVDRIVPWVKTLRLADIKLGYVVALLGLILVSAGFWIDDALILDRHKALSKEIIHAELNQKIYAALQEQPTEVKIISNYPLAFLPDLEYRQVFFQFDNFEGYQKVLAEHPEASLLLLSKDADQLIVSDVMDNLTRDEFHLVFEEGSWFMVERSK